MLIEVRYTGTADRRTLTTSDLAKFEADLDEPLVWSVSNGFIVGIDDENDKLLEFLRSQPDFEEA